MPTFQSMRQRLPSSYDTDGWRDLWPDDPNVFPSDEPASQLAVAPPSGPMGTGLANANVLAAALAQRGPDAAYQTDIVPANAVGSNGGFAPWAAGSGEPQTPFINTSWAGPTQAISGFNPPDLNIAVGLNNIMTTVNGHVDIYDRFGNDVSAQSLNAFFGDSGSIFDPRVMWDQYSNRFIVIADEQTGGTASIDYSRMHIAVSIDSDPLHGFYFYDYDFRFGNNWLDYPVLGLDSGHVYISGNYFTAADFYQSSAIWELSRPGLESGAFVTAWRYDVTGVGAPFNDLYTPAHQFGTQAGNNGNFFVEYQQNNAGNDTLRIDRLFNFNDVAGTNDFHIQSLNVGNISDATPVGARQPGTATLIDSGDDRVQNAVWFNNHLYAVTEIRVGSGATAHDVVHWFVVDTTNLGSLTLLSQGNIDYGSDYDTYYGNMTVDADGNMIIGYSFSGPGTPGDPNRGPAYASAVYATIPAGGTGLVDSGVHLAQGQGINTGDRWGDYSGIAIDPTDYHSFWVFNEYATNTNSWATRVGGYQLNPDDYANDAFTTGLVAVNGSATGGLQFAGDQDWFRVQLTAGVQYKIDLKGETGGAGTLHDPFLRLFNGSGVLIASNDDSGGSLNSQLVYTPTTTGTYYVDAGAFNDIYTGTYQVSLQLSVKVNVDHNNARYGNFGSDSRSDILFQSDFPGGSAFLWETNSSGAFAGQISLGPVPAGYRIDGTGQFNSTPGDDILLRSPTSVAVSVMSGTSPVSVAFLGGTSPDWLNYGIGEFTGDGQTDLLFRNPGTNQIATWGVSNNALSIAPQVLGLTSSQFHIIAVDDFTGDHQADILFRHDNGDIAIWRVANNALSGVPAVVGSTSPSYHVVGTGDFDGNSANDILFRNDNGDLAMWLLNSQGQLLGVPAAIGNMDPLYHTEGTGDLNGDGRSDIIFRDGSGTLVEWLMNGTSLLAPQAVIGTMSNEFSIAAHHFDLV